MKKLLLVALLFGGLNTFAQVTDGEKKLKTARKDTVDGWKKGGLVNINYTQVGLSNWAAGGQNSIAINAFSSLFANYKIGKNTWDNQLIMQFGQVNQADAGFIKSDDRIQFTSKYGRKASEDWYYAALLDFQTQFTVGYKDQSVDWTQISNFLAPAYTIVALGMDYKPSDNFTVFIAPLTAKHTIVNDDDLARAGAFGVQGDEFNDAGVQTETFENTRLEVGGYLRMMYKRQIMENISYQTNLALFSNYANNPQNIDVNWDNILNMKVNKYISASITTSLIYDDDVDIVHGSEDIIVNNVDTGVDRDLFGPRTQFKYVLGVGFAYTFGDK